MNYSNTSKNLSPKKRIWELDFLRGICVLLMIFDHTMYDLAFIFAAGWYKATGIYSFYKLASYGSTYWSSPLRLFVEPLVVIIFTTICGISCSFSKSNLKRGLLIGVFSILITIVTTIIEEPIQFGIFHMFTIAILLWSLINFLCKKDTKKTAFVCAFIGIAIVVINQILCSIHDSNPTAFTDNNNFFFVGEFLTNGDWNEVYSKTSDYQPIFPLVGYVMLGAAVGPFIYKNKKSLLPHLDKYDWYAPFNMWGKIAMWVYVFHQVIIAVLLALISAIFITPGDFIII